MDGSQLLEHARQVREAGALGRRGALPLLFEYLVAAAQRGDAPSEFDLATGVFGKPDTVDFSQDATVRVYVHRLRKQLNAFYEREGGEVRLDIPPFGYSLALVPRATAAPTPSEPSIASRPVARRWIPWALILAGLAVLNLLGWAMLWPRPDVAVATARRSAPWAAILADTRPVTIVLGDYYIFGEIDPTHNVDRLVREYRINSRDDLDEYLMTNPGQLGRYQDLDLSYLPVGSAFALREILPVLMADQAERSRTRIILASNLKPAMLKGTNVVYIGYLSGLGPMLRNPVFAGSRFVVGSSWDELIDAKSKRRFSSQQGGPDDSGMPGRDYGYVSAFNGPDGNHFVIIAGMRDVALMQAANAATDATSLAEQRTAASRAEAYEALFEVEGIDRVNMSGKLVLSSPLDARRIWHDSAKQFPGG